MKFGAVCNQWINPQSCKQITLFCDRQGILGWRTAVVQKYNTLNTVMLVSLGSPSSWSANSAWIAIARSAPEAHPGPRMGGPANVPQRPHVLCVDNHWMKKSGLHEMKLTLPPVKLTLPPVAT
jgi:hypothetical protein